MQAGIVAENVVKRFAESGGEAKTVLNEVSFSLEAGEAALLEGASGSGKSTLLNCISGLMLPDEGSVRLGERTLNTLSEHERDTLRAKHIGYIFQSFNLLSPLSILENLTIPLRLTSQASATLDNDAKAILSRFGLQAHMRKRPYQLSVGQRQRVAAARAILQNPAILLADEPTANLDDQSAKTVMEALIEMRERGATLIVATHDAKLKALDFTKTITLGEKEVIQ